MNLCAQRRAVQAVEVGAVLRHHRHLPGFQKRDAPRVLQDGRHIRGNEHLAIAIANRDAAGVAQPRRDQPVRLTAAEDHHRTGPCLLYTSDAADERSSVDLGGRRIIKKKKS